MTYNVHVFAVVRVKVVNVEGNSHIDAIEKAEKVVWDRHKLFNKDLAVPAGVVGIADTELADGEAPVCYLVDEQGDSEYERSAWYNADRTPWEE